MSREAFLVCYAVDRVTVTALGAEAGEQRWQLTHRTAMGSRAIASNGTVLFATKTPPESDGSATPNRSTVNPTHDDSAVRFPSRRVKRRLDA